MEKLKPAVLGKGGNRATPMKKAPKPKRRDSPKRRIPTKSASPAARPLNVVLGLGLPEFVILAVFILDQVIVAALLDYFAPVKDQDLVAETAG